MELTQQKIEALQKVWLGLIDPVEITVRGIKDEQGEINFARDYIPNEADQKDGLRPGKYYILEVNSFSNVITLPDGRKMITPGKDVNTRVYNCWNNRDAAVYKMVSENLLNKAYRKVDETDTEVKVTLNSMVIEGAWCNLPLPFHYYLTNSEGQKLTGRRRIWENGVIKTKVEESTSNVRGFFTLRQTIEDPVALMRLCDQQMKSVAQHMVIGSIELNPDENFDKVELNNEIADELKVEEAEPIQMNTQQPPVQTTPQQPVAQAS